LEGTQHGSQKQSRDRVGAGVVAACAAAIGVAIPPASAASPGVAEITGTNGTTLEYTARPGEFNDVDITVVNTIGGQRYLIDDRVAITPGNGCLRPDAADLTKVRCTLLNVRKIKVDVADGNDVVTNRTGLTTATSFKGGTGNDHLFGGPGSDDLFGDDGDDYITGGDGTDTLIGGAGKDIMYGEAGNDALRGDADTDYLDGGDGADQVFAGDGNDQVIGGNGRDHLEGNNGDDTIEGNANNDELLGGPGTDTLNGGLHDALPGDSCINGEVLFNCNP
jgi:serralysin